MNLAYEHIIKFKLGLSSMIDLKLKYFTKSDSNAFVGVVYIAYSDES